MQVITREEKIRHVTSIAYRVGREGIRPDLAWIEAIRETYPPDKVKSQLGHTCPKWAFSILCHRGFVVGMAGGSCPAAEGKRSANFVLMARELLLSEPSLAARKPDLKQRVFGSKGTPGFRTPNHEIEVLLALVAVGVVQI